MVTSTIINNTGSDVEVFEGTAGIYGELAIVKDAGIYKLKVDLNATHREYVISFPPTKEIVVVTSDDVTEYETFTVMKREGKSVELKKDPRGPSCSHVVFPKLGIIPRFFTKFFKGDSSL